MKEAPLDPIVADFLSRLTENLQEEFEERAAILEFDAKYPRRLAECLGLLDVLRRNLSGLTGVTALQIELDGQTEWLAVTDAAYVRQHLEDIHARVLAECDLRIAIDEQYAGCACLTNLG
jgi:hypothetical protein